MKFKLFSILLIVVIWVSTKTEEAFGNFEEAAHNLDSSSVSSSENSLPQCDTPHEFPTFIRIMKVRKEGAGLFIRRMESLTSCAETCRSNFDSVENQGFDCHGFGIIGIELEKRCEFYDEAADEIPLHTLTSMESKSTYFEKQCLAIPSHCTNAAFSFELQKDRILFISPIESIVVDDRKRCLNFCLSNPNCHSVNFNQHNGTCQVLDKTCRSVAGGLLEFSGIDHYENTCVQELNRCLPGQRVDFFVTRNAEIGGLDVTIGSMSLRNCMRECIDSTIMFCRSFEFDKTNDECFLVEEASEMSLPSATIDLYEPICLSASIDIPCSGDNVFERIPNVNLVAEGFIKHMKGSKVDYCMDECLSDDQCVSIVYDKIAKQCKLFSANRSVPHAKTASDVTTDLYELACDRSAVFKESRKTTLSAQRRETKTISKPDRIQNEDPCGAKIIDEDRTFRLEYRNLHHVNVKTQKHCKELCMTAKINCATFAYSENSRDCLLSTTVVEKNEQYDMITQPRQGYNLFTYMGYRMGSVCHPAETSTTRSFREQFFTTAPFSQNTDTILFTEVLQTTPFNTQPFVTTASKIETTIESLNFGENAFNFDSNWFDITSKKMNNNNAGNGDDDFENGSTPFNEKNFLVESTNAIVNSVIATTPMSRSLPLSNPPSTIAPISTTSEMAHGNNIETSQRFTGKKKFFDPNNSLPNTTTTSANSQEFEANNNIFGVPEKEDLPRRLMETSEIQRINISNIELSAICMDHGINVTFVAKHQFYTGAIYAAERFSQCRVLIENKKEFSIFINRPSENNWCNALEVDNMMTVVLVMSNDLVLPFDVTTKDDLFYQITCDYKEEPEMALIHSGVIVGGPQPKSVVSSLRHEDQPTKVALRILKDDHPVSDVFIGEKLTALVESEVNTTRVMVTECNATRVGGREPRPNSVQLIVNGCSLMPQIISNMFTGEHGLQATLTAFRIDGSDQIDIACNVVICRRSCVRKETCENVVKRHRRGVSLSSPSPIDILPSDTPIEDMVTVDQRLRVMVENEDSDDSSTASVEAGKNGSCLDPVYFLIVLGLFLLSVIALGLSFFANRCHRQESSDTESFGHVEPIRSIPRLERCNI